MGSTNDGTKCRLLKIDRAPPSPGRPRLEVEDGGVVYSESEIKELLIMLDDGNKYSVNKYSSHGLQQVASAFGIVGQSVSQSVVCARAPLIEIEKDRLIPLCVCVCVFNRFCSFS